MKSTILVFLMMFFASSVFAAGVNYKNAPVEHQNSDRAIVEQLLTNPEGLKSKAAMSAKKASKFEKVKTKLIKNVQKLKNKIRAGDLGGLLTTIGLILIIVGLVAIALGLLGIGSATISGSGALILGLILYLVGKFAI